jgi:hypothetical protein
MVTTAEHLVHFAIDVNGILGTDRREAYRGFTATDAMREANNGRLFSTLKRILANDVNFSLLSDAEGEELNEEWARMANCISIENLRLERTSPGLCLVMAFILHSIRDRKPTTILASPASASIN